MGCSHSQHSEGGSRSVVGADGAKEAGSAVVGGIEQAPDEANHPSGASNGTAADEQDAGVEPNAEHDYTSPDQTVQERGVSTDSVDCSGEVDCNDQGMPTSDVNDVIVAVQSRISGDVDSGTAISRSAATSIHPRERTETTILSNGGISLDTCKVSLGRLERVIRATVSPFAVGHV
jgi:hypothetical protein